MPGDTIRILNNYVFINSQMVIIYPNKSYLKSSFYAGISRSLKFKFLMIDNKNEVDSIKYFLSLKSNFSQEDKMQQFIVPRKNAKYNQQDSLELNPVGHGVYKEDYYFLIGDNFYRSGDSRLFGAVPASKIFGNCELVLFTFNVNSWTFFLKKHI